MLRSIRSRLLWAFLLPTLVVFVVAGAAGFSLSRRLLEDELDRGLQAIAAATASQVSGERLLSIERGDDVAETRTYRNLLRTLTEVRDASGARRVFAVDPEGRVRLDTARAVPVGDVLPELSRDRLELERVRAGEPATSEVLFRGSDGLLYKTGYAPVRMGEQLVGAIGVEGSARFFGPLERLGRGYALGALSALGIVTIVALLLARGLAAPLSRLNASAERIRSGDLSTPVPPEKTREIGALASQLEDMRAALQSRDRQLQMMLAGVAHEVRNPLGGIQLFAGLLSEELRAPGAAKQAREHLERIQSETRYLERIVEDFLAFARERKLAREPIDGQALIEAASGLLRSDAEARNVSVSITAERAPLEGDEGLLTAALVNLIKNAVQASPEGGTVELRGQRVDGEYRFDVVDRGSGIAAELRDQIFEPFFTTREKGTGLGLPLARKIVRAHGGELELLSQEPATTFRMRLPLPSSRRSP